MSGAARYQEPKGIVPVSDNLDDSRAEGTEPDYFHGAVTSAAVPEGMDELTVPAGTRAVFESSGPFPQAPQHLWRDVFTQWFPSNPYRSRPEPPSEERRAAMVQPEDVARAVLLCAALPRRTVVEELVITPTTSARSEGRPGSGPPLPSATARPARTASGRPTVG